MAKTKQGHKARPIRKPSKPLPIPKVNALRQALATPAWGKYRNVTFRDVVKVDLAWIHWLYRQKRTLGEIRDPSFLTLALICKHYPLGVDDEAERELAKGKLLAEEPGDESRDEDDVDEGSLPGENGDDDEEDDDDFDESEDDDEDDDDEDDVPITTAASPGRRPPPPHDPVAEAMQAKIALVQGCFMYGVDSDLRDELDVLREFTKLRLVFLRPGNDPPGVVRGTKTRVAVLDMPGYLCFLPDDIRSFLKSKKRGLMLPYPYPVQALRRYSETVKPLPVDAHVVKWPSVEDLAIAARASDESLDILETQRGAWQDGYTDSDVTAMLRILSKHYPDLPLGMVWGERRNGMCMGESELFCIEPDGTLSHAPDSIFEFLHHAPQTNDAVLPTREEVKNFLAARRVTQHGRAKPIYVGDYNYVWVDNDARQEEIDHGQGPRVPEVWVPVAALAGREDAGEPGQDVLQTLPAGPAAVEGDADRPEPVHPAADDVEVRPLQEPGVPAVCPRDGTAVGGGDADVLPVPDVREDRAVGAGGAGEPAGGEPVAGGGGSGDGGGPGADDVLDYDEARDGEKWEGFRRFEGGHVLDSRGYDQDGTRKQYWD